MKPPGGRGHKYGAVKADCGHCPKPHPSKAEARRCAELHLLEKAKVITHLVVQPQFWFEINGVAVKHDNGRRVGYRPDWNYFEGDLNVVEELKGFSAPDYALRKAIFKALYPWFTFRETGK